MKNILLIIFLNLLAMNNLNGQENKIISYFVEFESRGIISENEKKELLSKDFSAIPLNKINSYVLTEVAFLQSPNVITMMKSDSLDGNNPNYKKEGTFQISKELVELDLVSEELVLKWEETSKGQSGSDFKQLMLMFYAFSVSDLEELPEKKRYLDELVSKYVEGGLLTEAFQKDYGNGKILVSHPVELINYLKYGKVLKLEEFPKDISKGYLKIHETLNSIFDGIEIKLLEINVIPEPEQNPKNAVASTLLEINKEEYRDTFRYNYIGNKNTLQNVMVTSFNPNMIDVINERLRENDNVFRLYYINSNDIGYNKDNVGVVYLTRNQYHTVMENRNSIRVTGPIPSQHLNPSVAKKIIQEAKVLGLINKNIDTSEKELSAKKFSDLFQFFNLTQEEKFIANEEYNYTTILSSYSKAIGDEFITEMNKEIWDKNINMVTLEFKVNGEEYKQELIIDGARIDNRFRANIRTILKSLNLSKKLVTLGMNSNNLGMGYFTEEQISWLKAHEIELWVAKYY